LASSTAASPTAPPTARPPPGDTAPAPQNSRPLDTYSRGMSRRLARPAPVEVSAAHGMPVGM
jgi:hypothetical protein